MDPSKVNDAKECAKPNKKMAREQNLSIFQLEDRLAENELENVGSCIGQVYQDSWKFLIYLGKASLFFSFV